MRMLYAAILVISTSVFAQEYGRYHDLFGNDRVRDNIEIKGTDDLELYRSMADRPVYYDIAVKPGAYKVTVHYFAGDGEKDGGFTMSVDGKEVFGPTPCKTSFKRKGADSAQAASKTATVTATDTNLRLRFKQSEIRLAHAICGLEITGPDGFELRISCGSKTKYVDKNGKTWQPEVLKPIPDATITTSAGAEKGKWVDIGTEILEKLEAAGVVAMPKYKKIYVWDLNVVIVDRSGNTYLNLAGLGLWQYNGPGGQVSRADKQTYTATALDYQRNPYGPGFFLFSSHGHTGDTYQLRSLDGTPVTFGNFKGNYDYGAVDWTETPPKIVMAISHHRGKMDLSTDGGKRFKTIMQPGRQLAQVGVLPGEVLIHCFKGDRNGKSTEKTGIYRSEDLGKSWRKVSDINVGHSCFGIPVYRDRAYIYTPQGVAISEDDGRTWTLVPGSPAFEYRILIGKTDEQLMGFNKEGGFLSTDRGKTWKKVLPPPPQAKKHNQDHHYRDFAWDVDKDVFYSFAPNSVYRYQR